MDLGSAQTRDVYYGYDLRGLQLYARFDSGSGEGVTNVYDGFGRLTSSAIDMGSVTRTLTHQYDRNGNRVRITHPDGVWFQQDYDQLNRPSWLSHEGTAGLIYINRDDDGRPANINRDTGSAAYFTYDTARRVTGMSFDLPSTANDVAWTYGYNPARQIASVTRNNDSYAWTGHYAVTRPYTTNGLNQYTAAGGASFSYDANGNLTGDGARTFLFDVENRLVEVRTGSTVNGAIVYDPLGRIFSYAAGSSTRVFLYDGDALVAEYNPSASNVMTARYVHGVGADVPYVWYEGSNLNDQRFLYPDHQGSIVAAVGSSVWINRYDEYGIPQGTVTGRFAYTGQIYLPEIGLYHYKARVYSPTLGRMMQTDPVGYEGGNNLYAYVENDPVNGTDSTGLRTDEYDSCGSRINGANRCSGMSGLEFEGLQAAQRQARGPTQYSGGNNGGGGGARRSLPTRPRPRLPRIRNPLGVLIEQIINSITGFPTACIPLEGCYDPVLQEGRDAPPPGSRPIDQTDWSGDHRDIKRGVGAGAADDVRISPDGHVWEERPDGKWIDHGPAGAFTESGRPSGRTGRDRERRRPRGGN